MPAGRAEEVPEAAASGSVEDMPADHENNDAGETSPPKRFQRWLQDRQ